MESSYLPQRFWMFKIALALFMQSASAVDLPCVANIGRVTPSIAALEPCWRRRRRFGLSFVFVCLDLRDLFLRPFGGFVTKFAFVTIDALRRKRKFEAWLLGQVQLLSLFLTFSFSFTFAIRLPSSCSTTEGRITYMMIFVQVILEPLNVVIVCDFLLRFNRVTVVIDACIGVKGNIVLRFFSFCCRCCSRRSGFTLSFPFLW